jgi:hypothetical protein
MTRHKYLLILNKAFSSFNLDVLNKTFAKANIILNKICDYLVYPFLGPSTAKSLQEAKEFKLDYQLCKSSVNEGYAGLIDMPFDPGLSCGFVGFQKQLDSVAKLVIKVKDLLQHDRFFFLLTIIPSGAKASFSAYRLVEIYNLPTSQRRLLSLIVESIYFGLYLITVTFALLGFATSRGVLTRDMGQITIGLQLFNNFVTDTLYSLCTPNVGPLLLIRGGAWTGVPPVELPRASKIYTSVPLPNPSMNLIEPNCLGRAIQSNPRLIEPAKKIAGYLTWDKK